MNEHEHQVEIFRWRDVHKSRWPLLEMLYANPNGGLRNIVVAKKMKAEGQAAGVPDMFLPVPRDPYHGLYIELKRPEKHRVTRLQQKWIDALNEQGYLAVVCLGWREAVNTIVDYLNLPSLMKIRPVRLESVK